MDCEIMKINTFDDLIELLIDENDQKIKSIMNNSFNPNRLIQIDNYCERCGNQQKLVSSIACRGCLRLGSMINFRVKKTGLPFLNLHGKYRDQQFILSPEIFDNSLFTDEPKIMMGLKNYNLEYDPKIRYLAGSVTVIENLAKYFLDYLARNYGFEFTNPRYTSFVCNRVQFNFERYFENESIEINEANLFSMIVQLLIMLLELSNHNFSFVGFNDSTLIFNNEEHQINYRDFKSDHKFKIRFNRIQFTSFRLNRIQMIPKIKNLDQFINQYPFWKKIDFEKDRYRIPKSSYEHAKMMRISGIIIPTGSFNFYQIMISIVINYDFFQIMKNSDSLSKIWNLMWDDQVSIIEERIKTSDQLDSILSDVWLKSNILEIIFNDVKN